MDNLFLIVDVEKVHEVQPEAFIFEQNLEATETTVVNDSGGLNKIIAPGGSLKIFGNVVEICLLLKNIDTSKLDDYILEQYAPEV